MAAKLRSNVIGNSKGEATKSEPMSLLNAALFQFANPKAWIMAITGVSVFIPTLESFSLSVLMLTITFCTINLFCISLWALMGASLKKSLKDPKIEKVFSGVIVAMIIYSAVAVWI